MEKFKRKNPYVMRVHNKSKEGKRPRKGLSVTICADTYDKLMNIYEPNKDKQNLSSFVEQAIKEYVNDVRIF